MAGRKYASDYKIEKHLTAGGKVETTLSYQGKRFEFLGTEDQIRRLRLQLWIGVAAVFLLLLPMLLDNTSLSRTVYIVLPAALALAPLYMLGATAWLLGTVERPMIREHRDKTDGRLRGASVALAICLGISCAGCIVHGFLAGIAQQEIFCVICLFLAFGVSVFLLTQRNKAKAKEVTAD